VKIATFSTAEAAAAHVADLVTAAIGERPDAVLGLPAGNTPRPLYAELARRHRVGDLSFARAHAFNLDEYLGIAADHPASFRREMHASFYAHVDLPAAQAHAPDVGAADLAAACARYEADIAAAGGLDLVLLGVGGNGHIAFNEPGSTFDSRTRVVTLTDASRRAAAPAFGAQPVPTQAITMGIGTILSARRCVLMAFGAGKADIVARLVEGPVTPDVPASALQEHADALVVLDGAAASRLTPAHP
jgi:glucosamine-6-phosphate deaminase